MICPGGDEGEDWAWSSRSRQVPPRAGEAGGSLQLVLGPGMAGGGTVPQNRPCGTRAVLGAAVWAQRCARSSGVSRAVGAGEPPCALQPNPVCDPGVPGERGPWGGTELEFGVSPAEQKPCTDGTMPLSQVAALSPAPTGAPAGHRVPVPHPALPPCCRIPLAAGGEPGNGVWQGQPGPAVAAPCPGAVALPARGTGSCDSLI